MGNSGLIKRVISIPDHQRTWWQIMAWWELRRLPYNLMVALGGTLGLLEPVGLVAVVFALGFYVFNRAAPYVAENL